MFIDKWGEYNLLAPESIKIEVKSSAYIQSWSQKNFQKYPFPQARVGNESLKRSRIIHWKQIRPMSMLFVCSGYGQKIANPIMDLSQWDFYVANTRDINPTPENIYRFERYFKVRRL